MRWAGFVAALALAAPSVRATTIIGSSGASWATTLWTFVGQTFTVPASDTILTQWVFGIEGRSSAGSIDFSIREWAAPTIGATEYSAVVPWTTSAGPISLGLHVPLEAGRSYIAIYDLRGYTGNSIRWGGDSYAGGQAAWGDSLAYLAANTWRSVSSDTDFTARFESPEPAPIAFVVVGLGLMAMGMTVRRQGP